jgi:hypothetical protein
MVEVNSDDLISRLKVIEDDFQTISSNQIKMLDSLKILSDKAVSDSEQDEKSRQDAVKQDQIREDANAKAQEIENQEKADSASQITQTNEFIQDNLDQFDLVNEKLGLVISDQQEQHDELIDTINNGFYFVGAVIVFTIAINAFMRRFLI